MSTAAQYPFLPRPGGNGPRDLVPLLPFRASHAGVTHDLIGLVDTGSSFSVLPYDTGTQFGVAWGSLPQSLTLAGAGGPTPAKLLRVVAEIGSFAPVSLVFAWASSNNYPILLGQANFFFEFDVCLFRRRSLFEIQPATP